MVRETGEKHFSRQEVINSLRSEGYEYDKDYIIESVPNIVHITYGRDVGYTIKQERFNHDIEEISGTEIRGGEGYSFVLGDER